MDTSTKTLQNKPSKPVKHVRQRGGKIPREEKAAMIMAVIAEPNITIDKFGKKFGYSAVEDSSGVMRHDKNGGAVQQLSRIKKTLTDLKILPSVNDLLDASLHIVNEGQRVQLQRIVESPKKLSMTDISVAVDKAFKRTQLLQGKATNRVIIELAEIKDMKESDLDSILSDYSVREVV